VPLEAGDRLVMISTRTLPGPDEAGTATTGNVGPTAFDFRHWRDQVKSIAELSAFADDKRNLITDDGQVQLVRVAVITASGLRTTRVAPLLGRTLLDEDEHPGAPPVLVIGYEGWQRRFNGDSGILGQTVRLADTPHTIVGVMPEGFAFPIRHDAWVPLRLTELDSNPGAGPLLHIFGRIPDGSSRRQAQAEFAAIGERMAAAFPQSHRNVRPEVVDYAQSFFGIDSPQLQMGLRSAQVGAGLLLLLVAVNVAVLVYARTATRFGEIAVRTALGATRGRVVMQLFVEALVMSLAAAALGLTLLTIALRMFRDYLSVWPDRPDWWPYWLEPRVTPDVILYVGVLAVVAAALVGVLPALKATGKRVQASLQQFSSRSAAMRLGRTWTALIILQVAIAVAALPAAIYKAYGLFQLGTISPAPSAAALLRGTLLAAPGTSDAQFRDRLAEVIRRLEEDPAISAVTFAQAVPGAEQSQMIETESGSSGGSSFFLSQANLVATNLFDVFGVRVVAGRAFTAADAQPGAAAAIVDQAFADRLAPGGNAVGRRVRLAVPDGVKNPNPWMEIVGVVPVFSTGFTASGALGSPAPSIYKAGSDGPNFVTLILQVRDGDAARHGRTLQEIAASVDPKLEVEFVAGLTDLWRREQRGMHMIAMLVIALNGSVLLLSAAGIHAMMSFTVAKRWREIGIRVALGADARRVLMGIFGRASAQVGAGVAAGLILAGLSEWLLPGTKTALVLFPVVAVLMFGVGLLAAAGPARRGLAVEPTEALRNE
jgi:putative ABC transport system permease protein